MQTRLMPLSQTAYTSLTKRSSNF